MKQLLIILSLVIGAFIAACSQGSTKTQLTKHLKLGKTVEEMDKATSDEELAKFKEGLEKNKNLQISDVIFAVKNKFGGNVNNNNNNNNNENLKDKEDIKIEFKPTAVSNFSGIEMVENSDPSKIISLSSNNEQAKVICINTCDIQVKILKKVDAKGKVLSISAYVAVEIGQDKITPITSTGLKKVLNSLVASYEVSSDSMNLKFALTRESKNMIIVTKSYIYKTDEIPELNFELKDLTDLNGLEDNGSLKIVGQGKSRILMFNFDAESSKLSAKLKDDLGLLGKSDGSH